MQCLAYNETSAKNVFRPRHPLVSGLDMVGMAVTVYYMFHSRNWAVQSYFLTLLALYFVSAIHHWMPHANWRRKLDHILIFVVISMTMMPYWGVLTPFEWQPLGPLIIVAAILAGTSIKYFSFLSKRASALVYALVAFPAIASFVWSWSLIVWPWNAYWAIGTLLYTFQLLIYTFHWFDLRKDLFGFREVQHLILLAATTIHSAVAIKLVG